jgi:hypothetical protein
MIYLGFQVLLSERLSDLILFQRAVSVYVSIRTGHEKC